MLKRRRGHKRVSAVKYRKAVQSNIRPKPTVETKSSDRLDRIRNPILTAMTGKNWREMIMFGEPVRCAICGLSIEDDGDVSVDHIIPKSLGGGDIENNLQPAHKLCNTLKGSRVTGWDLPGI